MKNNLIKRIAQITGWIALGISIVLAVMYYIGISDDIKVSANIDLMMNWTLILLLVVIVFAFVIGPITSILTNPKSIIKGLISLIILGAIVGVAFSMSSSDTSGIHIVKEISNLEEKAKITDVGLISLYIMGGMTILAIFISEIKSLLKL